MLPDISVLGGRGPWTAVVGELTVVKNVRLEQLT